MQIIEVLFVVHLLAVNHCFLAEKHVLLIINHCFQNVRLFLVDTFVTKKCYFVNPNVVKTLKLIFKNTQVEMKDKIQKEYLKRTRKLLETKLSSRNLIKRINTWTVPLVRYSGPFLKWTRDELKQRDQRTRKQMTMQKTLHPSGDVYRLYISRKEGGRGTANIEDSVDASLQRLEDYIEKHKRGLITATRKDTDNTIDDRMTKMKKKTLWPL